MYKSFCYKLLGLTLCLLTGLNSSAFEVDGINYSKLSTGLTVATGNYSGDVVIPSTVNYEGIEYNVVAISNNAFKNCTQLRSVYIPSTVNKIGQYAFAGCTSLISVNVPAAVTIINKRAFNNCTSLPGIDLPAGITSIGEYAFAGCTSFETFTVPAAVAAINESAFEGCTSIKSFDVDLANTNFCAVQDVLFSADLSQLVFYPCAKGGKQYNVPATTTSILPKAFHSVSALLGLYVPGSVKTVGKDAFRYTSIKTAIFDEGVEQIGENAFDNDLNLQTLYLPTTLTSVESAAFSETPMLTEVIYPVDSSIYIPDNAFDCVYRNRATRPKLYVPESAQDNFRALDAWHYFNFATATPLVMDKDYKVDSLKYQLLDSVNNLKISKYYAPWVFDLGIPAKVTINGNLCTVTQIGQSALSGCYNITKVDIPGTVTQILDRAFNNCERLKQVTFNEGLLVIKNSAFSKSDSLLTVRIPASVTSIANKSFNDCAMLMSIEVDENNANYSSIDGVLFNKDGKKLITYPFNHGTTYAVPEGVTSIEMAAFMSSPVVEVTLPSTLQTINSMAFSDASKLKGIVIPEGVTKMNVSTFTNCTSLESVELPSTLTTMANDVFTGDTLLTKIRIHASTPPACSANGSPFTVDQQANARLIVPVGRVVNYLSVSPWNMFAHVEEDLMIGDVNNDGLVTSLDLTVLIDYMMDPNVPINKDNADCNRDGSINPADICALNDLLLGLAEQPNSTDDPTVAE